MTDPARWHWHVEPIEPAARCQRCNAALRFTSSDSLVCWTDGHTYHVGCLLDALAAVEHAPFPERLFG